MFTEDEADKKWCPFAKVAIDEHGSECIASGCMAWRWAVNASGEYMVKNPRVKPVERLGYCGLAGKPQ